MNEREELLEQQDQRLSAVVEEFNEATEKMNACGKHNEMLIQLVINMPSDSSDMMFARCVIM